MGRCEAVPMKSLQNSNHNYVQSHIIFLPQSFYVSSLPISGQHLSPLQPAEYRIALTTIMQRLIRHLRWSRLLQNWMNKLSTHWRLCPNFVFECAAYYLELDMEQDESTILYVCILCCVCIFRIEGPKLVYYLWEKHRVYEIPNICTDQ